MALRGRSAGGSQSPGRPRGSPHNRPSGLRAAAAWPHGNGQYHREPSRRSMHPGSPCALLPAGQGGLALDRFGLAQGQETLQPHPWPPTPGGRHPQPQCDRQRESCAVTATELLPSTFNCGRGCAARISLSQIRSGHRSCAAHCRNVEWDQLLIPPGLHLGATQHPAAAGWHKDFPCVNGMALCIQESIQVWDEKGPE